MTERKEEASELVRKIKQGLDRDANLRRLCELYFASVDLFFLRQGVQQKDREDLTQNVFLNVCKSIESLREEDRFEGWLFTSARNVFLTYVAQVKSHGRQVSLEENPLGLEDPLPLDERLADPGSTPLDKILEREKVDALHQACGSLPEQQRRCLELKLRGLSYKAISALLNIDVETVRSHLYEARKSLREKLHAAGPEEKQ